MEEEFLHYDQRVVFKNYRSTKKEKGDHKDRPFLYLLFLRMREELDFQCTYEQPEEILRQEHRQ